MVNIYIDCIKQPEYYYVEDLYSAYEIVNMQLGTFRGFISSFRLKHGDVHTCHDAFINHVGRFRRELGANWFGEELHVFAPEKPSDDPDVKYKEYFFKDNGQIKDWPYGIFG